MWWNSPEQERKETGRLEALSDGVFGVAATLLIFSVPVVTPETIDHQSLQGYLFSGGHWVSLLTYVVSFVTILVMWINHHAVLQFVARIDRLFVVLNGLLLMMIVFVNYPTALVANFINDGHRADATFATAAYSATLIVIALLYNGIWRWIIHRGLLAGDVEPAEVALLTRQYRFGGALYLPAFALAFIAPWASVALNAALAVYFAFTGQIVRTKRRQPPPMRPAFPHITHGGDALRGQVEHGVDYGGEGDA